MPDDAPTTEQSRIHRWLTTAPTRWFVAYAALAAFATYFCMYAFRKPFAAAKYEGLMFLGTDVNLKTVLLISQIIGYALSKYAGIKVCTEIQRAHLAKFLVGLILFAEFALFLFGLVPEQYKVAAIFLNGIPLGMVWGSVSRYLEGRRASEVMFAGLSCSYIVSSSSVKAYGTWLMERGIDQFWMPVVAGLCFLPLFIVAVYFLNQLPQPSAADVADRSKRSVMNSSERWKFFRTFLPAMLMLLLVYFFLTAYRDFRDNYTPEIFKALGYETSPELFLQADWPVAFGVMTALACLNLFRDHRYGLIAVFGVMLFGIVLMGTATLLHNMEKITGLWWMILIGTGAYLAYVPYGAVLFERVMASTKVAGTAVFAIYLHDAIGYTGSITVQLYKDLGQGELNYFEFLRGFTWLLCGLGLVCFVASCLYFMSKHKPAAADEPPPRP
ncbi:MAG: hypothetical protein CMO43_09420 [Verrucomicrobiales bacterium]|nr:hypothetical protein [Verrucomicrobiales bacterium]